MIDLLPNGEEQALAENFAQVLAAEAPLARLHQGTDADHALIRQLAGLGWAGLGVPVDRGGLGCGAVEEILLMREAGRQLVGPRLAATMLAAHLAQEPTPFIDGSRGASLAIPAGDGSWYRFDHRPGDACIAAGEGLALVEEGAFANPVASRAIDDSVILERGTLNAPAGDDFASRRFALWVAAILVGTAEAARDMAVAYAKVREQFGQPIGAFQAIKHRCADMALRCEAAWAQTSFAALALGGQRSDAAFQVSAARLIAGDAALQNSRGNVQVHGGIGFTEECDAQLFVRRTQLWLHIAGSSRAHQRILLACQPPGIEA
ncbi:acyl-CoA dehydrogenase family protein [Sphingosinicella ginsenosidimutans]|nr:acyl-CoA dehydrogenase [Sphingosinicella ginsenosidimutans]